jgi:hypothetical protein
MSQHGVSPFVFTQARKTARLPLTQIPLTRSINRGPNFLATVQISHGDGWEPTSTIQPSIRLLALLRAFSVTNLMLRRELSTM